MLAVAKTLNRDDSALIERNRAIIGAVLPTGARTYESSANGIPWARQQPAGAIPLLSCDGDAIGLVGLNLNSLLFEFLSKLSFAM